MNYAMHMGVTVVSGLSGLMGAWGVVELWERLQAVRQLRRERQQLAAMSDRELKDIGISRVEAIREANRSVWRADDIH